MPKKVNRGKNKEKKEGTKEGTKEETKEETKENKMSEEEKKKILHKFKSIVYSKIKEPHEFNMFYTMKQYNKHLLNLKNIIDNNIKELEKEIGKE